MSPSKIHNASPLDKAKAYEIHNWQRVAPLFTAARTIANASFVYFIGEEDNGPLKIGTAKCPVARLRAMQTGNSRRLRIEHVLMGDRSIEKLLHELWEPFAILSESSKRRVAAPGGKSPGTEWFRPEIREHLYPILDTAVEKQLAQFGGDIYLTSLGQAIRDAHIEHDHVAQGRDHVWNLAPVAGYSVARPSRL